MPYTEETLRWRGRKLLLAMIKEMGLKPPGISRMNKDELISLILNPQRRQQQKNPIKNTWLEALKIWNKGSAMYCMPRKGTPEYQQVQQIAEDLKKKNVPASVEQAFLPLSEENVAKIEKTNHMDQITKKIYEQLLEQQEEQEYKESLKVTPVERSRGSLDTMRPINRRDKIDRRREIDRQNTKMMNQIVENKIKSGMSRYQAEQLAQFERNLSVALENAKNSSERARIIKNISAQIKDQLSDEIEREMVIRRGSEPMREQKNINDEQPRAIEGFNKPSYNEQDAKLINNLEESRLKMFPMIRDRPKVPSKKR